MKYPKTSINSLLIAANLLFCCSSFAINAQALEEQAKVRIKKLYHTVNALPNTSMPKRIDWFSAQFKGVKYELGSLGEGPNAAYDQFPRYRTDGFDCDTYVNTVLSLALSNSLSSFQQCINNNRYTDGKVDYFYRRHFTDLDWNLENQQRGILKDITGSITDEQKKPIAQIAEAYIDKPGWYSHKTVSTIRLQNESESESQKRLADMKIKGSKLPQRNVKIAYLPLNVLFKNGKADLYLFKQIPQGAVIEIIRPNWNLKDKIGTNLNVSHLGFAIWVNGELYFREASSEFKQVVDVPLTDYLFKALNSPTIKGINVQVVVPKTPVC